YEFKDYQKMYRHRFLIFCDFEAILINEKVQISEKIKKTQKHIPSSFSLVVVNDKNQVLYHKVHTGKDCMDIFYKTLNLVVMRLTTFLHDYVEMMPLTEEQKLEIANTNICKLCKKPFESESDKRIDHDHSNGKFRSVLHNECNLKFQVPKNIPV